MGCEGSAKGEPVLGYEEHKGEEEIKAFFMALFTQLKEKVPTGTPLNNLTAVGPAGQTIDSLMGDPAVTVESVLAGSSVFLTWRTAGLTKSIDLATDSFAFAKVGDAYKISKQNIVKTEKPKNCVDNNFKNTTLGVCKEEDHKTCKGWANHFAAFGGQNVTLIMDDYTDASFVQVYDNNKAGKDGGYSTYKGMEQIKGMFETLFAQIGGNESGVEVKVLDVDTDKNTVFLVWTSKSHPKATDTFIFDDQGKILTQTIVASRNDTYQPPGRAVDAQMLI